MRDSQPTKPHKPPTSCLLVDPMTKDITLAEIDEHLAQLISTTTTGYIKQGKEITAERIFTHWGEIRTSGNANMEQSMRKIIAAYYTDGPWWSAVETATKEPTP